ncbi:MAG: polyphosphate kinase 1 [Raoultibacter sp.]
MEPKESLSALFQCERVIKLPGEGFPFVLIESVLELMAAEVFSMYTVKHTNIISVTRNADIDASDSTDETDDDYREHMKRILKKRSRLAPVRLVSEKKLSNTVSEFLLKRLRLKPHQVFVTSAPLDMSYTFGLADRVGAELSRDLVSEPFVPQWPIDLDRNRPIIDQVTESETLLSYPFESMDAFVQLLREAAVDPAVISIKITLYRLASQSHLAEALISAAENGKDVTALFELRARFDENNNIEWSQRFEQAGAKVIYGFRDFKVHSKICCITRRTDKGIQHITQLGTGNYNEKTAKLYTDLSFITTDEGIGSDATEFFRNMGLENASNSYDVLWVAPLQIKPFIIKGINREIQHAKAGEPCGLFFKTNSITDKDIIEKIAEASQAGVNVTLFVRGISCIIPGVKGYTDNVRVVSIVGRLLEHSRIYGFGPTDTMDFYLSSADLMTRNMEKRIEIAWPVRNESIRQELLDYIALSLSDTAKLRELKPDKTYTPLGFFAQPDSTGTVKLFDSQESLIEAAQAHKQKTIAKPAKKPPAKASETDAAQADTLPRIEHASKPQQQTNEPISIPSTSITLVEHKGTKKPSLLSRLLRLFVK